MPVTNNSQKLKNNIRLLPYSFITKKKWLKYKKILLRQYKNGNYIYEQKKTVKLMNLTDLHFI